MSDAGGAIAGVMLVLWVAGIALVIAWILLPFAMFGVKPLLRELIAETKRTNSLLQEIKKTAAGATAPSHLSPPRAP